MAKSKIDPKIRDFAKKIMTDLELKGGKILKLLITLAIEENCDRDRVIFRAKRALIGQ
ncbi:MAG: hypothetical protein HWN67_03435 [Candidatus Helarchaeota archaeon]|nr:hypothetical protein [Candidatus Helarchaeota archaeon]